MELSKPYLQKVDGLRLLRAVLPEIRFIEYRAWEPCRSIGEHSHAEMYQVDHFTAGNGEYTIDGTVHRIQSNCFYIVPPTVSHSIRSSATTPLQNLAVKFVLAGHREAFLPSVMSIRGEHRECAVALFRAAISEAVFDDPERRLVAALRLTEMLTSMVTLVHDNPDSQPQSVVDVVMAYMTRHFARPLELRELAEVAGISAGHLCRLFRREQDRSPLDCLRQIRCDAVKSRLVSSDARIGDIALATGFRSQQDMCRVFRAVVGETPTGYRRRMNRRLLTEA